MSAVLPEHSPASPEKATGVFGDGAVKEAGAGDWAPGRWVHIAEPLAAALEQCGPQLSELGRRLPSGEAV